MDTISEERSEVLQSPPENEFHTASKLTDPLAQLPESVGAKILEFLPILDLLQSRLVCRSWNYCVISEDLLYQKSCFAFDGRRDDPTATKCTTYMEESETKNALWDYIRLRRASVRQTTWVNSNIATYTVTTFELLNCTLNWAVILRMIMEMENLSVFIDTQDTYCWDYATFNSGVEEDENVMDTEKFANMPFKEKLPSLNSIKFVRIHRSQLADCTTYIKILSLQCKQLVSLSLTTDQNFQPQRAIPMYRHLALLTDQNNETLVSLNFPFKSMTAAYDFRLTDEHHNFREFLNHIVEAQWSTSLKFPALKELSLQYGIIPLDSTDIKTKLIPFLESLPNLSTFSIGCIFLEDDTAAVVQELISDKPFRCKVGLFVNDTAGNVPSTSSTSLQNALCSLSVQAFRGLTKEIKDCIPCLGIDPLPNTKEFQYFNKNPTFFQFNVDLLVESFLNLTHLNIVDHNSRIDTRHSSEAIATIEDEDMQLILTRLTQLVTFQFVGNMTFLTDSGLTGIGGKACKRMRQLNSFVNMPIPVEDIEGAPVSNLKFLKTLVFRGLGIKITDISINFGFRGMTYLKKLHLYGAHQVNTASRIMITQQFPASRGCDLQV